jgi:hypothetical protein
MTYEMLEAVTPPEYRWREELDEILDVKHSMTVPFWFDVLPSFLHPLVPSHQVSSEVTGSCRGLESLVH